MISKRVGCQSTRGTGGTVARGATVELHVGERVRERGLSEVMSEVADLRWGVNVLSTSMEPLQVVSGRFLMISLLI